MKKLLGFGLITALLITPSFFLASNNATTSNKQKEERIAEEFQYEGTQSIDYSFNNVDGPQVLINEYINVIDTQPGTGESFSDFVGLNFKLTGIDTNYTTEVLMPAEAYSIQTNVHWSEEGLKLEEIEAHYPWLSNPEDYVGKKVYTVQFWDLKEDNEEGNYVELASLSGVLWNPVKNAIPVPHDNPLFNVTVTFDDLLNQDQTTSNRKLWKESFVQTDDGFLLNYQYKMYATNDSGTNPTVEQNTYNARKYHDWLNLNFNGWGECNPFNCSQSSGGAGSSVLNYQISLVDSNGNLYPLTQIVPDPANRAPLTDIYVSSSAYVQPVSDKRTMIEFELSNPNNLNIDLRNYKLEYQITYVDGTKEVTEWANLEDGSENTLSLSSSNWDVPIKAYFDADNSRSYYISIRDANDPTVVITSIDPISVKYEEPGKFNTMLFAQIMIIIGIVLVVLLLWWFIWWIVNKSSGSKGLWPFKKSTKKNIWFLTRKNNKSPNNEVEAGKEVFKSEEEIGNISGPYAEEITQLINDINRIEKDIETKLEKK